MISEARLKQEIQDLREKLIIYESLLAVPSDEEIKEEQKQEEADIFYDSEKIQFLNENKNLPMLDLIDRFNIRFRTNLKPTSRALYNYMDREDIKKPIFEKSREEKVKFMRAYQNLDWKDLIPLFNERFRTNYNNPSGYLYGLRQEANGKTLLEKPKKYRLDDKYKKKIVKMNELLEKGYSQYKISKMLGVSSSTINGWLRNPPKYFTKEPAKEGKKIKRTFSDEQLIQILKDYYSEDKALRESLIERYNFHNLSNLTNFIGSHRHRIDPKIIGLKKYPTTANEFMHLKLLKITPNQPITDEYLGVYE